MGLYVEVLIRTDPERLWQRTQEPAQHQRWDLRFTEISHLPGPAGSAQRFRYATRVLPFLTVAGTGTSAGERHREDGERVSALRFASSEAACGGNAQRPGLPEQPSAPGCRLDPRQDGAPRVTCGAQPPQDPGLHDHRTIPPAYTWRV